MKGTVLDRAMRMTMAKLPDELGIDCIMRWDEDFPSTVCFSAPGREPVVVRWDGEEDYGETLHRARGALRAEFMLHPQKTPFRPGRSRVRMRIGGKPPVPYRFLAEARERNWVKPQLKHLGLEPW